MELLNTITEMGARARAALQEMGRAPSARKDQALLVLAEMLKRERSWIQTENAKDVEAGRASGLAKAKLDRLSLSDRVLDDLVEGLEQVAKMGDPVGEVVKMWTRPNGLRVGKMRMPLGVIGMIYESRPNVTVEAASLCLKSGNCIVLRGGSEAIHSNRALAACCRRALSEAGLPEDAVQLVQTTDREAVRYLLAQEQTIDVMIPRGGASLIRFVTEHARMPVLKHDKGVCHVYVDRSADLTMATEIVVNSKTHRTGVCNAMETLLVDQVVAADFLPNVVKAMHGKGVEIRGCAQTLAICAEQGLGSNSDLKVASEEDWSAEYLDLILAVRVVENMEAAMSHIAKYGSSHTESIVTSDYGRAHRFLREVTSSLVLVNASTRFNDGFQLGLGAEIGISTSRLHAFGPMGLEELTTLKFIAFGEGQIRS